MFKSSHAAVINREWFVGTFLLSAIAVLANSLSISLFFGVSFIFGSIAMVLAVVLYGTASAVIVAAVGSVYTLFLFGHPYALVIFSVEALVVGLLYARGMRNLVLADLIYWLVLGVFLVLLFYKNVMLMDWVPTWLIAFKQALNGVFNALIASILILFLRLYPVKYLPLSGGRVQIQQIFFIVGLSTILLAGLSPIIKQSYSLKNQREENLYHVLSDKAEDVSHSIEALQIVNKANLQSVLDNEHFHEQMSVAVLNNKRGMAERGVLMSLSDKGGTIAVSDNLTIWQPGGEMPTMLRWKNSRYYIQVPVASLAGISVLIESSARPLVTSLEQSNLDHFIFISIFMILGVLIVQSISHWFSKPIKILDQMGKSLADDITKGHKIRESHSVIEEFESLGNTLFAMSEKLTINFEGLSKTKEILEREVKKRTRELEFLNSNLKDRQYALDQHAIVSISDAAGDILYVNDKFCEVSEYSREELIGRNHRIVKSDFHKKEFYEELWETISSGNTWQGEICNQTKNGKLYWVQSTITPFLDNKGTPFQYIAIRTDITKVKAVQMELKESEHRITLAIEGSGDGIWDWDINNKTMSFSRLYEEMLGYDEHELAPLEKTWMDSVHPDDMAYVADKLKAYLNGSESEYIIELRLRCKNAKYKWILCRGQIVERSTDETPVRMMGIHTDISVRKAAEYNLIVAREEADRANKAKSDFLSSMSHELRTPMNAILGFGQLLDMDKSLTEHQHESVSEIMKGGHHLLELINEVLDLAKIESGHIDLSVEPVELSSVVDECFSLIDPLTNANKIVMSHTEMKGVIVRADRVRLKQALLNLISNAIKYNKPGGTVEVDIKPKENDRIHIVVTDSGMGINAKRLGELFQPFSRLDAVDSGIEGTGIGLTITKRIVELMGGEIGVESEEGKGSLFWIGLPLEAILDVTESMTESQKESTMEKVIEKQSCILYVDDNPVNLKLVSKLLSMKPHINLITAHTPVLGLDLAVAHLPELILLDINMPDLNGYEVLERIRMDKRLDNTPVIAVTADAMPQDIERGIAAGFKGYITKPINFKQFNETIDENIKTNVQAVPDNNGV